MRQSVWRRALRVGGVLLAMGFVVPPTAASAQRRVALVIGNAAYDAPSARLINPVNDARAMSAMLQDLDFEVTEATDANREQMNDAAAMFIGEVRPGDVALFYYAGHGMEIDGMNYLAPVEASPGWTRAQTRYRSFLANEMQESMEEAGARVRIVILDACRDNPFDGRSLGRGSSEQLGAAGRFGRLRGVRRRDDAGQSAGGERVVHQAPAGCTAGAGSRGAESLRARAGGRVCRVDGGMAEAPDAGLVG